MKPSSVYAEKYRGNKSQLYYFPWDANIDVTNVTWETNQYYNH